MWGAHLRKWPSRKADCHWYEAISRWSPLVRQDVSDLCKHSIAAGRCLRPNGPIRGARLGRLRDCFLIKWTNNLRLYTEHRLTRFRARSSKGGSAFRSREQNNVDIHYQDDYIQCLASNTGECFKKFLLGSAPVWGRCCPLVFAVVISDATLPFSFEGRSGTCSTCIENTQVERYCPSVIWKRIWVSPIRTEVQR